MILLQKKKKRLSKDRAKWGKVVRKSVQQLENIANCGLCDQHAGDSQVHTAERAKDPE